MSVYCTLSLLNSGEERNGVRTYTQVLVLTETNLFNQLTVSALLRPYPNSKSITLLPTISSVRPAKMKSRPHQCYTDEEGVRAIWHSGGCE